MHKILIAIILIIMAIASYVALKEVFHVDLLVEAVNVLKSNPIGAHVVNNIASQSELGIFYVFALFSLVFIPGPLEITFLAMYVNAPNKFNVLLISIVGILIGQIINYALGMIVSLFYKPEQKTKDNITKYGGWFIFAATVIPLLPSQFLNFVAGSVKFPFVKWLIVVAIGTIMYFAVLALAANQLTTLLHVAQ